VGQVILTFLFKNKINLFLFYFFNCSEVLEDNINLPLPTSANLGAILFVNLNFRGILDINIRMGNKSFIKFWRLNKNN
jgi:putative effector of murein hydrolase LrgA (UPF0299 family)